MHSDDVALEKRIQLAASGGAALAGAGVGVLLAQALAPVAWGLAVLGIVLHAWSMVARRHAERRAGVRLPGWSVALFWACWIVLGGLAVWLVTARR
jgi:hypothetical protein